MTCHCDCIVMYLMCNFRQTQCVSHVGCNAWRERRLDEEYQVHYTDILIWIPLLVLLTISTLCVKKRHWYTYMNTVINTVNYEYIVSKKTTLMLHTITSMHINQFWQFFAEMLLRQYAVIWWFVIPPLLTNVSALPGETWTPEIVFSVILYTMSWKRHCFGLLYLRHSSTNLKNFL